MYLPRQIVFDLDLRVPVRIPDNVWDSRRMPKRSTHFIKGIDSGYALALPETLVEARRDLARGVIEPAPIHPARCWRCHNWFENCKAFQCTKRKVRSK